MRTSTDKVEGALYRGLLVSAVICAAVFYPITDWLMSDPLSLGIADTGSSLFGTSVTELWLCALIGLFVTGGLFVITDYYTSTRFRPVKTIAQASITGHATNIIQGLAQGFQSAVAPALLDRAGDLRCERARRDLRDRDRGHRPALALRTDRRARRVRADHGQRRWHRRDGRPARGRTQRHRPARRGRQHHQGRHQGLRDRLSRARRTGAVRGVRDRARRRAWRREPDLLDLRPGRPHRPPGRRHDGLPVRGVRDRGRRPRRRRGRRAGPQAVPRTPRDHGGHRKARLRADGRHRHRVPHSGR